jgi:phospholipid/cholesterol/gamma-HCH transport system substrate-binding protein
MGNRGLKLLVFAAFTGLLTLAIAAVIVDVSTEDRMTLTAKFGDATGLVAGDEVRISGVKVGVVDSIELTPDGFAEVAVRVSRALEIPDDSEIAVRWLNLIGQRQVDIFRGTSSTMLADGDAFRNTRDVLDLIGLSDKLAPFAQALDPDGLNELFETVFVMLDGNEDNIAELLTNLDVILAALAERDATIGRLVDNAEVLTSALAVRDEQIAGMIDNLVLVAETFASSTDLIAQAMDDGAQIATDLQQFLASNRPDIRRYLDGFEVVAHYATERLDLLAHVIEEMALTLPPFFDVTRWGDFLNIRAACLHVSEPPCPADAFDGLFPSGGAAPLDSPAGLADLLVGRLR